MNALLDGKENSQSARVHTGERANSRREQDEQLTTRQAPALARPFLDLFTLQCMSEMNENNNEIEARFLSTNAMYIVYANDVTQIDLSF